MSKNSTTTTTTTTPSSTTTSGATGSTGSTGTTGSTGSTSSTNSTGLTSPPTCTVTNNCITSTEASLLPQTGWNGDILVISAYTEVGNATGFGQILQALNVDSGATGTYTPVVVTGATGLAGNPNLTNAGTPIANNGIGVVLDLLPAAEQTTIKGVTSSVPYSYWSLVAVQANNLFPVGEGSVSNAGDSVTVDLVNGLYDQTNPPYGVTWINPTTSTATLPPYVNAWSFIQEIQADPNGPLAQQWVAANQTAQASTGAAAIAASINSFFQSTHTYQNVTFAIYTWVNSYLNTFAGAWANFETSYTYYASSSPDSDAVHDGKTIVFTQNPTYPSVNDSNGMTNANGGYTIVFYNDTNLYFYNGQLRDSLTTDTPDICLQCTYTSLQQITNKAEDANKFYPMLTGTIKGEQVICLAWKPDGWKRTENALEKGINSAYFKYTMMVLNMWMLVDFIWEKTSSWYEKFKENKAKKAEAEKKAAEDKAAEDKKLTDQEKTDAEKTEIKLGEDGPVVEKKSFDAEMDVKQEKCVESYQKANPSLENQSLDDLPEIQKENQLKIEQEKQEFETKTEDGAKQKVKESEENIEPKVEDKINGGESSIKENQQKQLDNAQDQLDEDMQYQNTSQERAENTEIKQEQTEVNNESGNPKEFVEQSAETEKGIASTTNQIVQTSNAEGASLNKGTQAEINKVNDVDEQVTDDQEKAEEKIDGEGDETEGGGDGILKDAGKLGEEVR